MVKYFITVNGCAIDEFETEKEAFDKLVSKFGNPLVVDCVSYWYDKFDNEYEIQGGML